MGGVRLREEDLPTQAQDPAQAQAAHTAPLTQDER